MKNPPKIHRSFGNDQGFALPLVMGLGLVMVLVTAALLNRAQSDLATAASQARSDDSLSAAEAGIARVRSYLNQNRPLATSNLAQWPSILASLSSDLGSCQSVSMPDRVAQGQSYAQGQWLPTNGGSASGNGHRQQQYRVVDYTYRPQPAPHGQIGLATLTVVGQVTTGLRPATSRLAVEIPIGTSGASSQPPPPALWVKGLGMSRMAKITGNVRVHACPDRTPGISADNLALDAAGQASGEIATAIYPLFPQPQVAPAAAISLPVIKTSLTLPRPGDTPDANGNFHYAVESDTLDNSIQLPDGQKIAVQIAADRAVNIYTSGNIDLGGGQVTVAVANDPRSHPAKLRIYGSDRTRKFLIKDSASVAALIYAPQATGLAMAAPQTGTGIAGGLWLQHWDTDTHNSRLAIKQQGTWQELGIQPEAQLGWRLQPLSSWQRQEQP